MTRAPSISIIIPAFNAAPFLKSTLDSIRAQTVQDWECIVVDDGSQDGTADVVRQQMKSDARLRLVQQPNRGTSFARNHGYEVAHPGSEFVSFMDGDDLWLPDTLETLRDELHRHPDVAGVHGLAQAVNERGEPLPEMDFVNYGRRRYGLDGGRLALLPSDTATRFETLLWANHVFPPGVLLARRRIYEKAGLFDPSLRLNEDWDMVVRLCRHGELRFLDRVVLLYRRHDRNNSAANNQDNLRFARLMHHRNFFSADNTERQREIVLKSWRAWQGFMLQKSLRKLWRHCRQRRVGAAASALGRLYVPIHRYLRGYPTLRGL